MIKKIILFIVLMSTLFANASYLNEKEEEWIQEHPVIRVGINDFVPFSFINEAGQISGISADYLTVISNETGLKFETSIVGKWETIVKLLEDKKIDIIPLMLYSKENAQKFNLTSSYMDSKNYFFTNTNNPDIETLAQLRGKKIAVVKDFTINKWIHKYYPSIKLLEYNSITDAINSISKGEVDAFINSRAPVYHILKQNKIKNVVINSFVKEIGINKEHIAVRKGYKILATIMSKVIDSMRQEEKLEIFTNWRSSTESRLKLDGAFGYGRPPFMYGQTSSIGLELSMVRNILHGSGYGIDEIVQLPTSRGQTALKDDNDLEFSAGVVFDKKDGFYYSKALEMYKSVAVTRRDDNIKLYSTKDLLKHKVVAWAGFYEMYKNELPKELFTSKNYTEVKSQEIMHKMFIDKEVDVLLSDPRIFDWYKRKYDASHISLKVKKTSLFKKQIPFKVVFRSETIRDRFNIALKVYKNSPKYKLMKRTFLDIDINPQITRTKLLSSLLSYYILHDDKEGFQDILEAYEPSNIKAIKVMDANSRFPLQSWAKVNGKFKEVDSFDFLEETFLDSESFYDDEGTPVSVAIVRVYLDIDPARHDNLKLAYVPKVDKYENMNTYEKEQIKAIYEKFKMTGQTLNLTDTEQEYITNAEVIKVGIDPDWLPNEGYDKGVYTGIVADYLKLISQTTGLKFKPIKVKTWKESLVLAQEQKVDIISSPIEISSLKQWYNPSETYLKNTLSIVMNEKASYVSSIKELSGKTIAIPIGEGHAKSFSKKYPDIKFVSVATVTDALSGVSVQKYDACIVTFNVASYNISVNGYSTIKIVGKMDESTNMSFFVEKESPLLLSIMNKALLSLSQETEDAIVEKWIQQKYIEKTDYTMVFQVIAASVMLILIFSYLVKRARDAKNELDKQLKYQKILHVELEETNKMIRDSIEYASMIQQTLVPVDEQLKEYFKDFFAVWKPRDVVGGDIYFMEKLRHEDEYLIMMIDCTGHGVPGAFVTMLVKALQTNIIGHLKLIDEEISPARILKSFNKNMKVLLKQEQKGGISNAGFDAAILYINKRENIIRFSGAELPLYYILNDELVMIKGDRHSVGYTSSDMNHIFKEHEMPIIEGIQLFLTTDGYVDQNGGAKGFSFGKKRFKEILKETSSLSMKEIEVTLMRRLESYQDNHETNDDITLMGIKL